MQINTELVRKLIDEQFPQWSTLSLRPVPRDGHDNSSFKLGEQYLVRLPNASAYAEQVDKEQYWLPILAKQLSRRIPTPVALGQPAHEYPWTWSVYQWIDAEDAYPPDSCDINSLAKSIAEFLTELHLVNTSGGPVPGTHNFYRGGDLRHYDQDTREYCLQLKDQIDADAALRLWNNALSSTWTQPAVWVHGDLEVSNILVANNELAAVIDFGLCAVGDPACDLVMAWTLFDDDVRDVFRAHLQVDDATWERGKAWALWKALFRLSQAPVVGSEEYSGAMGVVTRVLSDT